MVELDVGTDARNVGSVGPLLHAIRTPASDVAITTVTRSPRMCPTSRSTAACGEETQVLTPDLLDPMTDGKNLLSKSFMRDDTHGGDVLLLATGRSRP
jgi:hypothetical protein